MGLHHAAGDHNGGHHILQPADAHQHGGHSLVTAGNKDAAVKGRGVGLRLHKVGDGLPMGQRIIDPVVALGHTVAQIGGKVAGRLSSVVVDGADSLLHKNIQVAGAGVAVAVGAFHHDLRLGQVLGFPAHSHAQGVHFRGEIAHLLAFQHIIHSFCIVQ